MTTTAPGGTKRVVAGGLAIDVPTEWQRVSAPEDRCDELTAPGVIVGRFADVRNCYMRPSPVGPAVIFAYGGPPDPPVPSDKPADRTVNGVAAVVLASARDGKESEFLALFQEWDTWLRVRVQGEPSAALAAGNTLLDTVRETGGQSPSAPPLPQTFIGHWYVHGALLDIHRTTAAVTWSCGASCTGTETLTLSRSADGRRLNASVARIDYRNTSTGRPIGNPDSGNSSEIGDTSYFEYVAPHLLRETSVHASATADDLYGNPYWCQDGLDRLLTYDCGA